MNPYNHNIFNAPEIHNPNYRSNDDSQMTEDPESNVTSTGTSTGTSNETNYSTTSSNFDIVGQVIYNVGPNERFNRYVNNQQVPEKIYSPSILFDMSTYNKLDHDVQTFIHNFLVSRRENGNSINVNISGSRLSNMLLLLRYQDNNYNKWKEFSEYYFAVDDKDTWNFLHDHYPGDELGQYFTELYQGYIEAREFYKELLPLGPNERFYYRDWMNLFKKINQHSENKRSGAPGTSIRNYMQQDQGPNPFAGNEFFGSGRGEKYISRLRHYNRKIARLLAEL